MSRVDKLSRCLRKVLSTASTLFLKPMALSFIWLSSSFMALSAAVFIFWSMVRSAFSTPAFAGCTTFSAELISSSDIWPCSAAADIIVAFSASNSAADNLSASSTKCFLAATRALKSLPNVLYGLTRFCASVNFCCRPENSPSAIFRASGANFLAAWSFALISLRASVIFSCTSLAEVSTSSIACFNKSLDSSGGSSTRGAASAWTDSAASSHCATSSLVAGKMSCSSLPSRSSAAWFAAAVSACFLAFAAPACAFVVRARTFWISMANCVCIVRSFGDSFDNSVTEPVAAWPPRRASAMSSVRDFCASCMAVCCFASSCCAACMASWSLSAVRSLLMATTAPTASSRAATFSLAALTRACRAAGVVAATPAEVAPAEAAVPPAAGLPAPAGSTKRMPGSALAASHGTFQPDRGGEGPWLGARAHTCEPPTWSPNHQPLKSAPSRWSQ
mmetsp:Transcript_94736/g.289836  ORF Transcript_94736/g.289836 Transcript_94736/m.289836 type:complete len:448 (-) Transcript_94736:292-1635(-)